MGSDHNFVSERACECGPPPEECIADEEWLTQHRWKRTKPYRNAPRIDKEREVSVLRGRLSVEEASDRVSSLGYYSKSQLAKAEVRYIHAGTFRRGGFAVVHTPGFYHDDPHTSIVWPADDPLARQDVPWPEAISDAFDQCFNDDEGEGGD